MTDNKQRHFIPSAPGFWTLDLVGSGEPDSSFAFWRYPIVAWEICFGDEDKSESGYFAIPVTAEWDVVNYRADTAPILPPDGRVRVADEAIYDNEEKWFEAAKARSRREARAKLKEAL